MLPLMIMMMRCTVATSLAVQQVSVEVVQILELSAVHGGSSSSSTFTTLSLVNR